MFPCKKKLVLNGTKMSCINSLKDLFWWMINWLKTREKNNPVIIDIAHVNLPVIKLEHIIFIDWAMVRILPLLPEAKTIHWCRKCTE